LRAIGYGALLMVWLSVEDGTVFVVSVLGAGLSLVIVWLALMRWFGGRELTPRQWIPGFVLLGALAGFGAVWMTVFLMVFKNAWHAHAALDFPGEVVVAIVQRLIPWTVAGALLGGAAALVRNAELESPEKNERAN
jgi:hypothetical protein